MAEGEHTRPRVLSSAPSPRTVRQQEGCTDQEKPNSFGRDIAALHARVCHAPVGAKSDPRKNGSKIVKCGLSAGFRFPVIRLCVSHVQAFLNLGFRLGIATHHGEGAAVFDLVDQAFRH